MIFHKRQFAAGFAAAVFALLWLPPAASPARATEVVTVLTEDLPPLNYLEHDTAQGPAVEIVTAITQAIGEDHKIIVYPWPRAYRMLQKRPGTVLFSMVRSRERTKLFKWVGPIAAKRQGLFAKKTRMIKLNELKDTSEFLVGVQRNGFAMEYMATRGHMNFDPATSAKANLKKLMAGRNDLWFTSDATLAGMARQLDINARQFEMVHLISVTPLYIAFHKDTDDAVIGKWQFALDALTKAGTVKEIYRRHELEQLYAGAR